MRKQIGLGHMVILLGLVLMIGCGFITSPRESPTPTPTATPELRFTEPSWESIDTSWYSVSITAVCDKKTGNLLYVMAGGERGGLAVVPGGCKDERDMLDSQ
jgi:hypothetical protein